MWVAAEYEATALFSLKPATATSSGGRTLPVPTPFAVKMALLDVACRVIGVSGARAVWPWLNECRVALRPAARLVVSNTFIKVLRPRRNPAEPGTPDAGFFQRTISYREYAYLDGDFGLALEVADEQQAAALGEWLSCLNYLGKRGGFIQLVDAPAVDESLDGRYVVVGETLTGFEMDSLLLQLDDTGPSLTFEKADIYSGKGIRLGSDRVLHHVALPYRLAQSSRGYSYYQLVKGEADSDGTAI